MSTGSGIRDSITDSIIYYVTLGKALGLGALPALQPGNIITYSNAVLIIDLRNIKLFLK